MRQTLWRKIGPEQYLPAAHRREIRNWTYYKSQIRQLPGRVDEHARNIALQVGVEAG